jgi:hypothetical protein
VADGIYDVKKRSQIKQRDGVVDVGIDRASVSKAGKDPFAQGVKINSA